MRRAIFSIVVTFSLLILAGAQTKADRAKTLPVQAVSESTGKLPVKRVVLYKNGVGYFEHSARVHATRT